VCHGRGVLAQRIKAQKPDLPIILATGFGDMPSSAHPDLIRLNKPVELTTLAARLARA
jgi:FixJ family two-component response regulator